MKLSFTKMHGLGNDFVVIDATARRFVPRADLLTHLADRRFGVGCDQILVVEKASRDDVDFDYRIFNADGTEVGQCGNGSRALARFVTARGLTAKRELRVATQTATMTLRLKDDDSVEVDMGKPRLEPHEIPLLADAPQRLYPARIAGDQSVEFAAVNMGNPHAVCTVADVERVQIDIMGPAVQQCGRFPQGVNVGFMQIIDTQRIRLRVYERGCGETLACGSGACAAMVAGRMQGLLAEVVTVTLPGGSLAIAWAGEGESVRMTGPAEFVFDGELEWMN